MTELQRAHKEFSKEVNKDMAIKDIEKHIANLRVDKNIARTILREKMKNES
jgi:hypothetical protein